MYSIEACISAATDGRVDVGVSELGFWILIEMCNRERFNLHNSADKSVLNIHQLLGYYQLQTVCVTRDFLISIIT